MSINPLVSCIIPSYKRNDTITRALDSVLAQSYSNIEIIIVDDNTPNDDYSLKLQSIVNSYNNPQIIYLQQENHRNGAAARNFGILHSHGDIITFLDDDDEWCSSKIEKQIQFLKENPNYDGVSCLYSIKRNGETIQTCKPYSTDDIHKKILNRSVAVCTPTLMLKRDKLLTAGLFDERLLRHQDLQLLLDFTLNNALGVLNEDLVIVHADSEINRPNTKRLIEVKKKFFEVIRQKHLESVYSRKDIRLIMGAHYFEIIYTALKEKKFQYIFKYLWKVGFSIGVYRQVLERYLNRN